MKEGHYGIVGKRFWNEDGIQNNADDKKQKKPLDI